MKPNALTTNTASKSPLHPNNPHQGRYDLDALTQTLPALTAFLIQTPKGEQSIDFANAKAVLCLNQALLKHFYGINEWRVPQGFLCPPIPGRADYIHHIAQLVKQRPASRQALPVQALDIGTGANLIYPIVAHQALGWHVVGNDISAAALKNAQAIIDANGLHHISLRLQKRPEHIFKGVIQTGDYFDVTVCNPPFFKSANEASKQAQRKWRNLKGAKAMSMRNFGGQEQELWCDGGEFAFIRRMMEESVGFAQQVGWFTTLISDQDHVAPLKKDLKKLKAAEIQILEMGQGQKRSHILAWRF